MCLCLTHLRNRRGPWVQPNLKTEQARKRGREKKKERKELYWVGEGGGRLASSARMKRKKIRDEVGREL